MENLRHLIFCIMNLKNIMYGAIILLSVVLAVCAISMTSAYCRSKMKLNESMEREIVFYRAIVGAVEGAAPYIGFPVGANIARQNIDSMLNNQCLPLYNNGEKGSSGAAPL